MSEGVAIVKSSINHVVFGPKCLTVIVRANFDDRS